MGSSFRREPACEKFQGKSVLALPVCFHFLLVSASTLLLLWNPASQVFRCGLKSNSSPESLKPSVLDWDC